MILADCQISFMLHLESYLEYEKGHEVGHRHQLCLLWFIFVVSTLIQALNECKTFDFSVLQAYHQLLHSKKGNWTTGRLRHSVGLYCPHWMVLYRVNKLIRLSNFHDPLKRQKLNTLASDSVIKKDNAKAIPLLIYYVKLYMLHP